MAWPQQPGRGTGTRSALVSTTRFPAFLLKANRTAAPLGLIHSRTGPTEGDMGTDSEKTVGPRENAKR